MDADNAMDVTDVYDDDDMNNDTSDDEDEKDEKDATNTTGEVYLPGKPLDEGEELVCDESAYVMLHQARTGAPCLSFDIIPDQLGAVRETFPMSCYVVAGSQAAKAHVNNIIIMRMSNLHRTSKEENEDEEDYESDSDDDENEAAKANKPIMNCALIKHNGCINRIRATQVANTSLVATWSELGRVNIWSINDQLLAVDDMELLSSYNKEGKANKVNCAFTFSGHQQEGYGIDWSPMVPGLLATGDCRRDIHIWQPNEAGTWNVDQRPLIGHTESVEDLQWSPNVPAFESATENRTHSEALLVEAVRQSNVTLIKSLFASGVTVNPEKQYGLLKNAIRGSSTEVLQLLIDNGLNVNLRDNYGRTVIYETLSHGYDDVNILKMLVKNGAIIDVDTIPNMLSNAFWRITTRVERVLDFLFENGADINGKYYPDGETLLHKAIRQTDPSPFNMKYLYKSLFKHLICRGADVNAQNDQGYAPLHLAVNKGNEVVAQLLLENGANVNMVTNNGITPLAIATTNFKRGNIGMIIILIKNGAIADVGLMNWLLEGIKLFEGSENSPIVKDLIESLKNVLYSNIFKIN